jgi:hypothetical protein
MMHLSSHMSDFLQNFQDTLHRNAQMITDINGQPATQAL